MAKLSGVWQEFRNLEDISAEDIQRWLPAKADLHTIEDYLANRITYPQTIPVTRPEMEMDLAILKEAFRRNPSRVYSVVAKKITVPHDFTARFGSIANVVLCVVYAIKLKAVVPVFTQNNADIKKVGSVFVPSVLPQVPVIPITANDKTYQSELGKVFYLPITAPSIQLGVGDLPVVEAIGGQMGVIIDLR